MATNGNPNPFLPHLFEPMIYIPERCNICGYGLYDSLHNEIRRDLTPSPPVSYRAVNNSPHLFEPDELLTDRCYQCGNWKAHRLHEAPLAGQPDNSGVLVDANAPHTFAPSGILPTRCAVCGGHKSHKLHHMLDVKQLDKWDKPLPEFTEKDHRLMRAIECMPWELLR